MIPKACWEQAGEGAPAPEPGDKAAPAPSCPGPWPSPTKSEAPTPDPAPGWAGHHVNISRTDSTCPVAEPGVWMLTPQPAHGRGSGTAAHGRSESGECHGGLCLVLLRPGPLWAARWPPLAPELWRPNPGPQGGKGAQLCPGPQLSDALPQVEGKFKHGGCEALVDEVPGQAALGREGEGREDGD